MQYVRVGAGAHPYLQVAAGVGADGDRRARVGEVRVLGAQDEVDAGRQVRGRKFDGEAAQDLAHVVVGPLDGERSGGFEVDRDEAPVSDADAHQGRIRRGVAGQVPCRLVEEVVMPGAPRRRSDAAPRCDRFLVDARQHQVHAGLVHEDRAHLGKAASPVVARRGEVVQSVAQGAGRERHLGASEGAFGGGFR